MSELLNNLLFDYTLRTVALGAGVLGILSGALGSFAVLRKQSLLGDAVSHAALPGIALAFLLTLSKATLILILGAALAGWIGTYFIFHITRNTRIKNDSALGLILSVFFGFGLVLLTYIQKQSYSNQAGLDKFLFGQAAALLQRDVLTMIILSVLVLSLLVIFWKEFKLLSFNADYGSSLGLPVKKLDFLLTGMLVIAIVIGLQTVGVVLMSAMVVAPAAAARQWTERLGLMVILSSVFGAFAGISGALLSSSISRLPTGPTIVVCISFVVLVSVLFASGRGLVWTWLREQRNRHKIKIEAVLSDLYILAEQHGSIERSHPISVLRAMSIGHGGVDRSLGDLKEKKWVEQKPDESWVLTPLGLEEAKKNFDGKDKIL
jgi:manganese/zinc/iron transport system permease protein